MLVGFGVLLLLVPIRYVLWAPAPPIDVYASQEQPSIVVEGTITYPVTGRLLVTSVSVTPADGTVSLFDAVTTFLMDDRGVFPREVSYPLGAPMEQVRQEGQAVMSATRRAAVVAALRSAGFSVQQAPMVTHVVVSGPSYGRLLADDIIIAVEGRPVSTAAEVNVLVGTQQAGNVVSLLVQRGDVELHIGVPVVVPAGQNQARIGITMEDTYRYQPIIVSFLLDTPGVTSAAGLVLAVGLYDYFSPDDLIAGRTVAGTGIIDVTGAVTAASGVSEKLRAAADAGAELFLLPAANCQDIAGGTPSGMTIIKVTTLDDAVASLRALRDDPAAVVPTCEET
ncbi:MAG: PDZ domain-containing protein [Propionibacteriaceae bacterium]|jgi:PDZ domain-containing protein|nr:PDZ domain-containing protein [Propionibacteriaceae bacterium]